LGGNAERGKPRRTFLDKIGQVLKKGLVNHEYPKLTSVYEEFDECERIGLSSQV
jgi:hypothetical protein